MSKILLIEDDLSLIDGLTYALRKQGFEMDIARTVKEANNLFYDGKYDLLILDLTLPDGSGFEVCKKVRQFSKVPIIFLTASEGEVNIIMGLDIGGDDYITKPFKMGELISRINALIRKVKAFQTVDADMMLNGIKVLPHFYEQRYKKAFCNAVLCVCFVYRIVATAFLHLLWRA